MRTLTGIASPSGGRDGVPGIIAVERLLEIEDAHEILLGVVRLLHQQPDIDEGEDDLAEVGRVADTPVREHLARDDAVALERA